MTELVKTQSPIIKQAIDRSRHILLHCHPSPDPDSLCSALAMRQVLMSLGKTVILIAGDSPLPDFASMVPGGDQVVPKNWFAAGLADFDLFISLDSASLGQISRLGEVVFPEHLVVVNIDHHATNPGYGQINLVDSSYPATAQILFDLFTDWGIKLDHDLAINLFLGIYTDTGGFRYRGTNSDTFACAAALTKLAPDFDKVIFALHNNNKPAALKFEALALNSIETCAGGRVAMAFITQADLLANQIKPTELHVNIAAMLISVTDWLIGAMFTEIEPGVFKVSLRTRDQDVYDVAALAKALDPAGGGHKGAAGVSLRGDLAAVKQHFIDKVEQLYFKT